MVQLLAGAEGYEKQNGPPIRPITVYRIKRVLKRMSPHKAKGLDHWGPDELKALPHTYLEGLADIHNAAEEEKGEWPAELRQVMVALNPKPRAEHEGQLRPIGL